MPLLPTLRNLANAANQQAEAQKMAVAEAEKKPVSYTHLTLPTTPYV